MVLAKAVFLVSTTILPESRFDWNGQITLRVCEKIYQSLTQVNLTVEQSSIIAFRF